MKPYDVIVVGGGAAGLVAAISAKRKGASVLICEKMPKLGKKLLVTGAGRCNLLNEKLDPSYFNPEAQKLVASILERYGKTAILDLFKDLGLAVYTDELGRIFPVTNQASSVLKLLEIELERLKIPVELNCEIRGLEKTSYGFALVTPGPARITSLSVILCAGGRSYPSLGADGNGYALAQKFGHEILEPVPSTVPLTVKDPWCHILQGQKVKASLTSQVRGKTVRTATGELLFTQYGLSGTAALDVSDEISVAINREKVTDVMVSADLIPFMNEAELTEEISRRFEKGVARESLLEGLLPHKFSSAFREILHKADASTIVHVLKHKEFKVQGTRGWNEAEFTAGGIQVNDVKMESLESKLQKGLYFAGEILDVQGRRGGYNLAWAWASGLCAGAAA